MSADLKALCEAIKARNEAGASVLDAPMCNDVAELAGRMDEVIELFRVVAYLRGRLDRTEAALEARTEEVMRLRAQVQTLKGLRP
jgi:hypothetical protein